MFKAGQVMTREVVCVTPETGIHEAMRRLVDHGVSGLPVVDAEGELVGIVTEKDALRLLYRDHVKDTPVSDYMTTEVFSFDENDDLADVCECLIANSFRRVPILSRGKLAGIISRKDIIRYILELRGARKS